MRSPSVSPGTSSIASALAVGFDQSVDDGDVGMIQRGEDFGFAVEAGEPFGIVGEGARKNPDSDLALQLPVTGAIDLTRTTQADRRANLIRTEFVASSYFFKSRFGVELRARTRVGEV